MLEPLYLLKARKGDWTQLHKHIGQMIAAKLAEVRRALTRIFVLQGPRLSSGN